MMMAVPLLVAAPLASRHLLPYTRSCLLDVYVHCWLVWPWQSYSCTRVPLVCVALGTSMHRPDCTPTIVPEPPGVPGGVLDDWLTVGLTVGEVVGVAALSALSTEV